MAERGPFQSIFVRILYLIVIWRETKLDYQEKNAFWSFDCFDTD